jgi:hypothetical protein
MVAFMSSGAGTSSACISLVELTVSFWQLVARALLSVANRAIMSSKYVLRSLAEASIGMVNYGMVAE